MLEKLKAEVLEANLRLKEYGLALFTWGNASGIDREAGLVVIKPSGVEYDKLKASDMVVVDLDGQVIEGDYRPSSDTPTHLVLYRHFPGIGGVAHTHSAWATAFAQAKKAIPALGTTHADCFFGEVPCTRSMTEAEIQGEYEKETGMVIVETFKGRKPEEMPAVLVSSHGPFTWGKDSAEAAHNAAVLEEAARMAHMTLMLSPDIQNMDEALLRKHYFRKHGSSSYYGQK